MANTVLCQKILRLIFLITAFLFIGCAKPSDTAPAPESEVADLPDTNVDNATEAKTDVLIYGSPGTWRAELNSLKSIMLNNNITYETKSDSQMNRFTKEDFTKYHMILFVGGDAPTVKKALTKETRALIRDAVQNEGLNYLGFCAGAWLAVAPAPRNGEDVIYGIGVVNGPVQELTYLGKAGKEYSLDEAQFPSGERRKLLWYGGPVTPEVPGGVIARYSDGKPAVTQMRSGKGLVIISGFHPAATKSILNSVNIHEPEAIHPEFALELLQAAIQKKYLPAF